MKNKIIVRFGIVFVIGIVILLGSIKLGTINMSSIMQINGGSMDTNVYLIYLEQSIIKFRFLGSILSLLGGLGVIKNIQS
ncbi:hypothetical protein [Lacrimispora saccharolytica]|uniref:Uncharacterized protein n=1 Tax=Lacrimispora saccharolytica (strain ATCC 35040 / DSM 2544 / NRCC 2533 / WM1) TaxID=610130 RepID=D9R2N2_LACSW|nr:hypothetical protein [Lacrimispora saccharolytica]ADL06656.1 hypothetical protein Closa_4152 [[Clostridium] saccharolyticum WM1]QRV19274.1 hypothetical protein I6K70_17710 [Lacrimispora saccharolytica]